MFDRIMFSILKCDLGNEVLIHFAKKVILILHFIKLQNGVIGKLYNFWSNLAAVTPKGKIKINFGRSK